MNAPAGESLGDFLRSFSYGSRNDLSFKFLKHLPEEEAAEFLRRLLSRLGDAYDTGEVAPLVQLAYEAQVAAYAHEGGGRWAYDDAPFSPLRNSLAESRLLLMTSSGHFAEAAGRIGELAPELLSFPGAAAQGRLLEVLPRWLERVRGADVDLALLVPV